MSEPAYTVSSCGLDITIQCNDHETKDRIFDLLADRDITTALSAEREACAKVASGWSFSRLENGDLTEEEMNSFLSEIGPNIAAAIRARAGE